VEQETRHPEEMTPDLRSDLVSLLSDALLAEYDSRLLAETKVGRPPENDL